MTFLQRAAGLCMLAVVLGGCSQGGSVPTETMLTMPVSPPAAPSTPDPPQESPPVPSEGMQAEGRDPEASAPADPSEHCVLVAGGVTTAMLAPLSLRSNSDPEDLVALEQQILGLRDKVPADLHDDFTTLAHSVEAPPRGSGTFDEKGFRRAMVPVQDWLTRHCAGS